MARSKINPDMIRTNAMIPGNTYGMGDIGKKAEGKRPVRFVGLFHEHDGKVEKVAAFPKMKELTTDHTLRVVRLDTESPEEITLYLNAVEPIFCLNPEKKATRQTFTNWKGGIAPIAPEVTTEAETAPVVEEVTTEAETAPVVEEVTA